MACCYLCAKYSAVNQLVLMRPQGRQTNVQFMFVWGPNTACCIFADRLKNSKTFHRNSQLILAFHIEIINEE